MSEHGDARVVTYRPFEAQDFEAVAELVRATWCEELGPKAGPLAARLELSGYLALSTWGIVAERGGELLGVMLARRHGTEGAERDRWLAEQARLQAIVDADPGLAELVKAEMAGVAEETALAAEYEATDPVEADVVFKLLIVSASARGLGVGGKLFQAAVDYARSCGARGYYLLTDDACDVTFYDHKGLTQAMRKVSEAEWPEGANAGGEDFHVYVYSQRF